MNGRVGDTGRRVDGIRMSHGVWSVLALASLALCGCQKTLPTAPSDLTAGVVIYEHANYVGASAHLTRSVADLKDFKGPCRRTEFVGSTTTVHEEWNDCISSVRVAPGWRVQLFRDDDYKGQVYESRTDVPNLQLVPGTCDHDGLNDCVTSIRIYSPDGLVVSWVPGRSVRVFSAVVEREKVDRGMRWAVSQEGRVLTPGGEYSLRRRDRRWSNLLR